MFATSSVATVISGLVSDLGSVITDNVSIILGLFIALVGLGWGVSKFRKYIAGKKF